MGNNQNVCKNCDYPIHRMYCENCGQRTSIDKVTFKETFQDFVDMVFSVNAPLFLTLKMLVVNPGKLFREYLSGKRKKYYKPVAFLILSTIILVIIKSLINFNPLDGMATSEGLNEATMSLISEASLFFSKNGNNIVFIFVFTLALCLKVFFFKRYLFAEYVAVSFYIIGFYTLITSVLFFYLKYASHQYRYLPFLFLFIYIIYSLTSFFQSRSFVILSKIFFIYFISLTLYIILGFGLSFSIVWLRSL